MTPLELDALAERLTDEHHAVSYTVGPDGYRLRLASHVAAHAVEFVLSEDRVGFMTTDELETLCRRALRHADSRPANLFVPMTVTSEPLGDVVAVVDTTK